jgi:transposase
VEIARNLGCATQTVRNAIHAFEQKGLECLKPESCRPKTVQAQFDQAKCEALRALLHQSPRIFGKATSLWTLTLATEVCFEQGLTVSQVSIETIRQADPPPWDRVAASERLDHQSRSRICPEEKAA